MAERIGWIGLGKMGMPMATHLVNAGHDVLAFDLVPENVAILEARGARRASTVKEVARGRTVIFISVPDDHALRAVALGEEGLTSQAEPGTVLIDTSTVSPSVSAEVGGAAIARGIGFVRATVSGSTHSAEAAMLTVLASGPRSEFERVLPLLRHGRRFQHRGDIDAVRVLVHLMNVRAKWPMRYVDGPLRGNRLGQRAR